MKTFITIALLCALFSIGNAQITITADEMVQGLIATQNNTDSYGTSDSAALVPLIALNGPNKTWDFSSIFFTKNAPNTGTTSILIYPGGAALANDPDFTSATHVIKILTDDPTDGIIYSFIKADQSGFYQLGLTQDSMGKQTKILSYNPGLQQYKFPLTFGTSWSSTSNINTSGAIPGVIITIQHDAICDGYGILGTPTVNHSKAVTPMASTEALRIATKEINTFSILGFSSSTTTYNYDWITKDGHSANISADSSQAPISGSYGATGSSGVTSVAPEELLNLHLSQNPAANTKTTLYYTLEQTGNVDLRMMDALGREVKVLHSGKANAGENIISIDPAAFTPGSYFIHLSAGAINATRKLVITK